MICVGVASIGLDRKSTRLNSSHLGISYAVFCLKKKNMQTQAAFTELAPTALQTSVQFPLEDGDPQRTGRPAHDQDDGRTYRADPGFFLKDSAPRKVLLLSHPARFPH